MRRNGFGRPARAVAALALVMVVAFWMLPTAGRPATAQEDPVAVVEAFVDALNAGIPAGEVPEAASFFAEDGSFTIIEAGGESFGIFGRSAIEFAFSQGPDPEFQLTIVEIAATDGQVTGRLEFRDSNTVEAGIERGVSNITAQVVDGRIASLNVVDDLSDPQTAQLAEFLRSQPEEDEGPPPADFVVLDMAGEQEGHTFLGSFESVVFARIEIEAGPEGALQPSGIHEGTCEDLGELVSGFAPVLGGGSSSILSVTLNDLLMSDHVLAVAASEDDPQTIVSCGAIERAQEPMPTVSAPTTGTGARSGGSTALAVAIGLAAAGGVLLSALGALRLRRR